MASSQIEQIRSLDEAMQWFERELQWGVPVSELTHLVGRIGNLYVAVHSNGQLAVGHTQLGYDVVSVTGERYSVSAIAGTTISGEINFTRSRLERVDRVATVFFNTDEMDVQILLDSPVADLEEYVTVQGDKIILPIEQLIPVKKSRTEITVLREVKYKDYMLFELENGDIEIELYGEPVPNMRNALLKIAQAIGVPIQRGMGRVNNSRVVGTMVIDTILSSRKA